MIKIIGAIIIFSSTTWIGFEFARKLVERTKQLQVFRNALQTLEAEIMYGHIPLGEAARKISSQLPEPVSTHFRLFADKLGSSAQSVKDAWEESLKRIWSDSALRQNEYEILVQFGENLGKHDRQTEQKHIMLTLAHLQREEEEARDKQNKYEKLAKNLGVLSGLLIIILLL